MSESAVPARASAAPAAADAPFDIEADIVVVGGGGGGLPAALFARWLGNEVVLLEKAPELGGTARKAAFWYWVPNNAPCATSGSRTAKRTSCATSRASRARITTTPTARRSGLSEWEFALCRAIYESASPAAELLRERGALPLPALSRRARLLGGAAGGQGADGSRPGARGRPRVDERRRRGGCAHDERGGRARRGRHPHRTPRAAPRHGRRRASSASRPTRRAARPSACAPARR